MKRTAFVLTLLALLMVGYSSLQAQGAAASTTRPVKSGMPVISAYNNNLQNAVYQGDVQMAQAHRTKLVNFMERDLQSVEAASVAAPTKVANPTQVQNLNRQKAILAEIKALNLDNAAGLSAAKAKLPLIDEYESLFNKRTPSTN